MLDCGRLDTHGTALIVTVWSSDPTALQGIEGAVVCHEGSQVAPECLV
jgi:hypothetical protein